MSVRVLARLLVKVISDRLAILGFTGMRVLVLGPVILGLWVLGVVWLV